MYPERFQLPALTAHVMAALERRRGAIEAWSDEAEATLTAAANEVLADVKAQFAELADDPAWWARLERGLTTVALPRYLVAAKAQHALERRGYDLWRGGDLVARAAYAAAGLVAAVVVWRTAIPNWLEPLPLAFFIGGPLLPDLQGWFAKRRYRAALDAIVADMAHEAAHAEQYRPIEELATGQPTTDATRAAQRERT